MPFQLKTAASIGLKRIKKKLDEEVGGEYTIYGYVVVVNGEEKAPEQAEELLPAGAIIDLIPCMTPKQKEDEFFELDI